MSHFPAIEIKQEGLGHALTDNILTIPRNQRSYDWTAEEVRELFTDLADAMASADGRKHYFLGSIVSTQGAASSLEIVDGQQRLATTAILLAAIRDHFYLTNDERRAKGIEGDYLLKRNLRTQEMIPNLRLNRFDNDFFIKRILSHPRSEDRKVEPRRESHEKISAAAKEAARHVKDIISPHSEDRKAERLIDWVEYVRDSARVVWVTAADPADAFKIFETLNWRGKDLSTSDLLKNYLMSRSDDRIDEVEANWTLMLGALESVTSKDVTVPFLRQLWCSMHGLVRERELYAKVREATKSKQMAIEFSSELNANANLYAALMSSDHEYWSDFGTEVRKHVKTLLFLNAEQVRILLLPILKNFSKAEIKQALKYLVCAAVRLLIAGGSPGSQEDPYAQRAVEIRKKTITKTSSLAQALSRVVPDDAAFENVFSTLRVNKGYLARYYLRALEETRRGHPNAEMVVSDDEDIVTLEHILPQNPSSAWAHFTEEDANLYYRRLGNMTLLKKKLNTEADTDSFENKKKVYAKSQIDLTRDLISYAAWTPNEINARQKKLASEAVKTWPINVK
jgi:hypothetical protein